MITLGFDEWCTITTIFLSVVAIIIAIWSSRSTSKAAEKQIREIKNFATAFAKYPSLLFVPNETIATFVVI